MNRGRRCTKPRDEPNLFLWIKIFLFNVNKSNKFGKSFSKVTKLHLPMVYSGVFRNSFSKVTLDKALFETFGQSHRKKPVIETFFSKFIGLSPDRLRRADPRS